MVLVLVLVPLVLIVITWLTLRDRINAAESRLRWSAKQDSTALEQQVRDLTARVFELERQTEALRTQADVAKPEAVQSTVRPQVQPATVSEAPQVLVARAAPAAEMAARTQEEPAPILPPPVFAASSSKASLSDRLRQAVGDREWETLVAGSVMNKVGALILVIGIALFLGYSFRFVNPAGRSAIAALVSACILAGGAILERRQQYRLFSRGLIGAGWAALYLTAYAMYALPAARVISSPFAGSVLLLAVGTGMVAHSLRYRVQAITAVAYFSAFAALAATPSTPFAVASLVPLVGRPSDS
jgi:outer membrane murein-binding lipoprotein Lpp